EEAGAHDLLAVLAHDGLARAVPLGVAGEARALRRPGVPLLLEPDEPPLERGGGVDAVPVAQRLRAPGGVVDRVARLGPVGQVDDGGQRVHPLPARIIHPAKVLNCGGRWRITTTPGAGAATSAPRRCPM